MALFRQAAATTAVPRRALVSWCLYDGAPQAFFTIIITFVFANYFTRGVAEDKVQALADWSTTIGLSMIVVAATAPVLGAIADQTGRRKPWIFAFTALLVAVSVGLWFVEPDPAYAMLALILIAIGNFAGEMATVFYNAMLPTLAPPHRQGRVSGWGWSTGYAGGILSLAIALVLLIQPDPPLFGLDPEAAEPVRATALLVAAWTVALALPMFLFTPDAPAVDIGVGQAARQGMKMLIGTLRRIRDYRNIVVFLIARMLYTDGLTTVFNVGAVYAGVTFGMDFNELLLFGIALNVMAGIGAFGFGWIDDWIGAKKTILISVGAITLLAIALLLTDSKAWFWGFAMALSTFLGPSQSASRSYLSRVAPPKLVNEMFGLYAFSGKATAFLGPLLFGAVTSWTGSQRLGLSSLLIFFVTGFVLMLFVKDPGPNHGAAAEEAPPPGG